MRGGFGRYNKALNRSVLSSRVGKSPDGSLRSHCIRLHFHQFTILVRSVNAVVIPHKMFRFLHQFFAPDPVPDGGPVVIACAEQDQLSIETLALEARDVQKIFGLKPSVQIRESTLLVYSDQEEYIKVWTEAPNYLRTYLPPKKHQQIPFEPTACIVVQYCYYGRRSLSKDDPNYFRKDLCPSIAEHLWDRLVWRFQEITSGVLVIDDEGIHGLDNSLIVDWT